MTKRRVPLTLLFLGGVILFSIKGAACRRDDRPAPLPPGAMTPASSYTPHRYRTPNPVLIKTHEASIPLTSTPQPGEPTPLPTERG